MRVMWVVLDAMVMLGAVMIDMTYSLKRPCNFWLGAANAFVRIKGGIGSSPNILASSRSYWRIMATNRCPFSKRRHVAIGHRTSKRCSPHCGLVGYKMNHSIVCTGLTSRQEVNRAAYGAAGTYTPPGTCAPCPQPDPPPLERISRRGICARGHHVKRSTHPIMGQTCPTRSHTNSSVQGIASRDAAAALRGHKMYVLEHDEVELEEDEYKVRDIVGAQAFTAGQDSVYLGEIVGVVLGDDISSTVGLASDMLELQILEQGSGVKKVCYVPFVPAYVPVVRLANDTNTQATVLLELPDGFLDLAVEVEEKLTIRGFLPG